MGRISHSRCTSHVAATISGRILAAAYMSRLLASSPTAVFRSSFWHSSPINGSGLLTDADAVESSTWRAGVAALGMASVEDTTHGKISLCKNRLHMFT
jgi:hypothetical protein